MPPAAIPIDPDELTELRIALASAFSPAAPVSRKELFAGRIEQIKELVNVIGQAGQHAVIFGERGVGKTSMAATMTDMLTGHVLAARVNCDVTDTFGSL